MRFEVLVKCGQTSEYKWITYWELKIKINQEQ